MKCIVNACYHSSSAGNFSSHKPTVAAVTTAVPGASAVRQRHQAAVPGVASAPRRTARHPTQNCGQRRHEQAHEGPASRRRHGLGTTDWVCVVFVGVTMALDYPSFSHTWWQQTWQLTLKITAAASHSMAHLHSRRGDANAAHGSKLLR